MPAHALRVQYHDRARLRGRHRAPVEQSTQSRTAVKVVCAAVTTGTIAASTVAFTPAIASAAAPVRAKTGLLMGPGAVTVKPGQRVDVSAFLFDVRTRRGLANQPVHIEVGRGYRWVGDRTLRTDSRGWVHYSARLMTTNRFTAVFDGSSTLTPSNRSNVDTITVRTPPPAVSPIGQRAVWLAAKQAGKPYLWGGNGPGSFDCSGLTVYVYRQLGRSLPRTTDQQYAATRHIAQSSKQLGDLIFFGGWDGIYHVGIYAGNGNIWHAPKSGDVVRLTKIWTSSYLVGRPA